MVGGGVFNFPSQSKKKPKPNTDRINRSSINGVIVDRKYNMFSLNQTIFMVLEQVIGTTLVLQLCKCSNLITESNHGNIRVRFKIRPITRV